MSSNLENPRSSITWLCVNFILLVGDASWFNLYIPSRLDTHELSGNSVNCLSPMNLSRWFLNVFKVGAVTTCSSNTLHGEITCDEKKFLQISFLRDFFFPIQRTAHLFSVIPANDDKESRFGYQYFSSPTVEMEPLTSSTTWLVVAKPQLHGREPTSHHVILMIGYTCYFWKSCAIQVRLCLIFPLILARFAWDLKQIPRKNYWNMPI